MDSGADGDRTRDPLTASLIRLFFLIVGVREKLMKSKENRNGFPSCFILFWLVMVAKW
jgi:hypothetical protein